MKSFILFALLALVSYFGLTNKSFRKDRRAILQESEDASGIYKGKIKAVYNPLDQAWKYDPKLANKSLTEVEKLSQWYLASLWIDPLELNDKDRGIFMNPKKRGKLWERASQFRLWQQGNLKIDSVTGMRVHGGSSRSVKKKVKSFRVYFYNQNHEARFIPFEGQIMRKMVVRKPDPHYFSNDLSFFLFELIGQEAPKIYPAKVYLNGEMYSYMFLSSHQARDQIKLDYKLKDFFYYKQKSENDTIDHLLFEKAVNRLKYNKDLSFQEFSKEYDAENLMKNLVINIFTGSQDWPQGSFIKEKGGKWRVIPWDFDTAFRRPYKRTEKKRNMKPAYRHNPYKAIQEYYTATLRWYLFNDFVLKRDDYKQEFLKYLNEFLEVLARDTSKLEERYRYYESLTKEASSPAMKSGLAHIKEFMRERPQVVCDETKKLFKTTLQFCRN